MKTEILLSVRSLSAKIKIENKSYFVVEELSFDLKKGKTLAIVGESGSGKTFTALSLMRLPLPNALPPTGEVIYKEQNLLTLSEREMRKIRGGKIAMIFQDPANALNPVYRIGDQLIESVNLHQNLFGEEALEFAINALKNVHIPSPEKRIFDYPHQLSGGMKQRVMIAMALIGEPDILIADEPTTALDVTIQQQVLDLIRDLQKKKEMALLLITHDMGIVAEMADDVVVMYASNRVEKGSLTEIFDQMAHPYTIGLFNCRPNEKNQKGNLEGIKGASPSLMHYPSGCRFHPRCPFVMEACKRGKIPDFRVGDESSHLAKCLLFDPNLTMPIERVDK